MTSGRAAPTKTDPPSTGDSAGQAIMEHAGMEHAGMAYAERDTGAL